MVGRIAVGAQKGGACVTDIRGGMQVKISGCGNVNFDSTATYKIRSHDTSWQSVKFVNESLAAQSCGTSKSKAGGYT